MGVPTKFYTFVDGQTAAGLINAARLNGNLDPLFACLDPASGGLEDTNVKAGAKILCSDRNYTGDSKITGDFEFDAFPTVPDASIPAAKLGSGVAADTLDGSHAADFAPVAKGVTNGDSHDHSGGDGAAIVEAAITLADNVTNNVGTAKHGFCPKAPNDTTKFLRGDASWAVPPSLGYALSLTSLTFNPLDGTTYYFGNTGRAPQNSEAKARVYIPKAGTITIARILAYCDVVASSEQVSVYVRKNGTTDTLIQTAYLDSANNTFINTSLGVSVAAGDYIEIKIVCPTFGTNPTGVYFSGVLFIE